MIHGNPQQCVFTQIKWKLWSIPFPEMWRLHSQTSNVSRGLVGNKLADHLDVVGALPVSAAPNISPFSIWFQWIRQTTARRDEKHLSFAFGAFKIRGLTVYLDFWTINTPAVIAVDQRNEYLAAEISVYDYQLHLIHIGACCLVTVTMMKFHIYRRTLRPSSEPSTEYLIMLSSH